MTQDRKDAGARPGWRGPGSAKPAKGSQKSKASKVSENMTTEVHATTEKSRVPAELQQEILNIYKHTFSGLTEGGIEPLKLLLQGVKQALYERDFERAFGRQDYLEAYAFRWSPSRALCYLSILVDLQDHLSESFLFRSITHNKHSSTDSTSKDKVTLSIFSPASHVVSLGGGAAEVVAFGGLLRYLMQNSMKAVQDTEESSVAGVIEAMTISDNPPSTKIGILLLDTAAWGDVIYKLSSTLTTPPPLSKYASASARASNAPLLTAGVLNPTFQQNNLLTMNKSSLESALGQQPLLITLLFTLNELYTTSITATTAFLLNLTGATVTGTILLVVDSPGSYSEATVGKDKKKYPMQWLMDRTLLGDHKDRGKGKGDEDGPEWEKLMGDESRWFRMPEELKYPISLENMRYQIHLFRRL
jgi:25S rRNA (uracil2843-N3)-methyltransferase